MKKLIIVGAVALASASAQAQIYGEAGYTAFKYKLESSGNVMEAEPAALRGIIGYELNPHLAIEGLVAIEASDSQVTYNQANRPDDKYAVDYIFGVYLKPKIKLGDKVEIFGRAGFAEVRNILQLSGVELEATKRSFSYGAGISYAITPTTYFNADYMQYLSKDGFTVNGLTFGFGFKF